MLECQIFRSPELERCLEFFQIFAPRKVRSRADFCSLHAKDHAKDRILNLDKQYAHSNTAANQLLLSTLLQ